MSYFSFISLEDAGDVDCPSAARRRFLHIIVLCGDGQYLHLGEKYLNSSGKTVALISYPSLSSFTVGLLDCLMIRETQL